MNSSHKENNLITIVVRDKSFIYKIFFILFFKNAVIIQND